jgi:hypothetical protein
MHYGMDAVAFRHRRHVWLARKFFRALHLILWGLSVQVKSITARVDFAHQNGITSLQEMMGAWVGCAQEPECWRWILGDLPVLQALNTPRVKAV